MGLGCQDVITDDPSMWMGLWALIFYGGITQQYCLDGVLLGAASGMHEALVAANTLDEVIDAHKAYLKTAKDRCFLTPSLLTKRCAQIALLYSQFGNPLCYVHWLCTLMHTFIQENVAPAHRTGSCVE